MNPFERLRHTIDRVNITYQFPEDQPPMEAKTAAGPGFYQQNTQPTMSVTSDAQLDKIKQLCQQQQLSFVKELTDMSAKIEQLQKNNKRSQNVIENQMNEIVSLQKQNQLLKGNLTQQYSTVTQGDEKERKYKEQIYRINVTINELAVEIQAERNSKKQLLKEIQVLRERARTGTIQFEQYKEEAEKDKLKILAQLEERVSMFEYNVKKAAEDRKEFKVALASEQQSRAKEIQKQKGEIDALKMQLSEAKKAFQIETIHKNNLQDTLNRQRADFDSTKQENKGLIEQIAQLRKNFSESEKGKQQLQKSLSELGSELAEEKKNMRIKVVEVRDETLSLELQMYKKQCKELMQQKFILKSMIAPQQGCLQPQYKIIKSQQASSV